MEYTEKRKAERLPIDLILGVSELFKQDNEFIKNVNAPIEVLDISRGGIGFHSESELPVGYYFNARIQVTDDMHSAFYTVVKIIRKSYVDDKVHSYGCEFVGFPSVLNYIFDDFEKKIAEKMGK